MIKGKYFHRFIHDEKTGKHKVHHQGLVKDYDSDKNIALVILFSWVDGQPNGQFLKTPTEDWVFYETNLEMEIAQNPYSDLAPALEEGLFHEEVSREWNSLIYVMSTHKYDPQSYKGDLKKVK